MGRIIGLDLGSKTCGVAISDQTGFLARALTTIRFEQEDYDDCFDQILNLLEKEKVNEVVLGLPKHMNGDVGIRGQLSIDFGYELEQEGYHVTLWDERLTTVSADNYMMESGIRREDRKKYVDEIAAIFILQGYLDYLNLHKD